MNPNPKSIMPPPLGDVAIIITAVARSYPINPKRLISRQRAQHVVVPRHIAMFLAAELTSHSLTAIGTAFDRDHTTVMHAIRVTRARMGVDPTFATTVETLKNQLSAQLATASIKALVRRMATDALAVRPHVERLAEENPRALVDIVEALLVAIKGLPKVAAKMPRDFERVFAPPKDAPPVDGKPCRPTRPPRNAMPIDEAIKFLQRRGVVVYRNQEHPELQQWIVDGKGLMDRDGVAAYAEKLKRLAGAAAAGVLALVLAAAPAAAQTLCNGRAETRAYVEGVRNQVAVAEALTPNGRLVEIFVGRDRRWSLVITNPDLLSCLALEGGGLRGLPAVGAGAQWASDPGAGAGEVKRRSLIRWRNRGRHWLVLPFLLVVLAAAALLACAQSLIDSRRKKEA